MFCLASDETIEKLIENVGKTLRENQQQELSQKSNKFSREIEVNRKLFRIEILKTSNRDVSRETKLLKELRDQSTRDLILQNHRIDWTNISQLVSK